VTDASATRTLVFTPLSFSSLRNANENEPMNKPLTWIAALLVLALQAGCDRRPEGRTSDSANRMSPSNQSASSPMGRASAP